ncbi:MAG: nickel pincer cofactor biosynthesis protein LarC [Deltaproteobacteria bacterium]|nr:nickel pincer cofactor biosynthesis protein LarC [Deltaproteobacteria bacterium]
MLRNILLIDALGGLSGDMFLGAFLDLGLPVELLRETLAQIGAGRFFTFEITSVERHGIAACKVDFPALAEARAHPAPRTLRAVENFLHSAGLPENIAETSRAIFQRLGAAEARVHGTTLDKVHFHEVGDYDTLADIVGVATALAWCAPKGLHCKPVPLGTGFIDCAHGRLPVPVPAVMALLEGLPVVESGIEAELVTPTGAAILKTLSEILPPAEKSGYRLGRSGYGAGSREHRQRPNLLRLSLGTMDRADKVEEVPYALESLMILEVSLDDLTPEKLAALQERLLVDGALDVVTWPVVMKKGRIGMLLQVLLRPQDEAALVKRIFSESPTLGIRRRRSERYFLEREICQYQTSFGPIRCKIARDQRGQIMNLKPEHDDLAELAARHGLALTRLEQMILSEISK